MGVGRLSVPLMCYTCMLLFKKNAAVVRVENLWGIAVPVCLFQLL